MIENFSFLKNIPKKSSPETEEKRSEDDRLLDFYLQEAEKLAGSSLPLLRRLSMKYELAKQKEKDFSFDEILKSQSDWSVDDLADLDKKYHLCKDDVVNQNKFYHRALIKVLSAFGYFDNEAAEDTMVYKKNNIKSQK